MFTLNRDQSVLAGLVLTGAFLVSSSSAFATVLKYTAMLTSADVVPAPANQTPPRTPSPGSGKADIAYDTTTKVMTWTVSYNGLSGPATSVKFHSPADPGHIAPPTIVVYGSVASPIVGNTDDADGTPLTDDQQTALQAGKMYLDIATSAQPLGEVRGQIMKQ